VQIEVTAMGNAGVRLVVGPVCVYIDSFFTHAPWVGTAPVARGADVTRADLILVTHAHPDHFDPQGVAEAVRRSGAAVAGPRTVATDLRRRLPDAEIVELEPAEAKTGPALATQATIRGVTVTALRTFHGRYHNSYLVAGHGWQVYHDGDNEDTRRIDTTAFTGVLDAVFICPWQGSDCAGFVTRARPRAWFLVHLTAEELDEQDAGTFLPPLCGSAVPPGVVSLRPGRSIVLAPADRPTP
jgi:hypothetical protein